MNPPLIGITERRLSTAQIAGVPATILDTWMSAQLVNYSHAVHRAGGIPVHLSRESDAAALAARLDGLVFAGGFDVDPRLYGSVPGPKSTVIDPRSDRFEISLALEALQHDLPTLGICRGMQLLNVALGGTLVEDLAIGAGASHAFLYYPPTERVHPVSFIPGSKHYELYGPELWVNSLHHQAVGEPGEGVTIVGRAEDGVPEAIAIQGRRVLGVQWHPEFFREHDPAFDWLVAEAAGGREGVVLAAGEAAGEVEGRGVTESEVGCR